mgnify:CR=1 FL=1
MNIDYELLRKDLLNYFGTAMIHNPVAIIELSKVQRASNSELENIAIKNGFDLRDYEVYIFTL